MTDHRLAPFGRGRTGEAVALQSLADAWACILRRHPTQWAAGEPPAWCSEQ